MTNKIKGKIVVITGASSGLGEAAARLLSAQGASVVLGARRSDRLKSLADELNRNGRKAVAVATDVTHRNQVKKLVDTAVQEFGRIDVMINNAGIMPRAPLERLTVDDWDRTIDVNIKGVLYGMAAALLHMKKQKSGHMIFVSSVAGHKIGPDFAVYAATKHAVRALKDFARKLNRITFARRLSRRAPSIQNCRAASPSRISPKKSARTTKTLPSLPSRLHTLSSSR